MQTVETLNEGLKRAYTLTITAKDIDSRVDAELKRVAPTVKMPGFRPGKVPANLVRKMHGEALMQDALNSSIQQGMEYTIQENLVPGGATRMGSFIVTVDDGTGNPPSAT